MDSRLIVPFVQSVQNVFQTMLQLPVKIGKPTLKAPGASGGDVSGIIGMSGDLVGSIILSMDMTTATRVVGRFTGEELAPTHEDFPDAIGELVNMVSGAAKAKIAGRSISISCPSVVVGQAHAVHGARDVTAIAIPCSTEVGLFAVEVWIRRDSSAGANVPAQDQAAGAAG